MAKKDFSNTQTGGEGVTPQVGDKPTATAEIKKEQGRPKDLTKDEGVEPVVADGEPKKQPVEEKPKVADTEKKETPIPTQPELEFGVQEEGEPEIPLIENIDGEDKPMDTQEATFGAFPSLNPLASASFAQFPSMSKMPDDEKPIVKEPEITPEGEPEKKPSVVKADSLDRVRELYKQGYRPKIGDRIEGAATLAEIENTWIQGRAVDMALEVEPEKVFKTPYPSGTDEYKIIDGYWHQRGKGTDDDWSKSTLRFAKDLNRIYDKQASLPERIYPPKGGVDFEGMKVYGNPWAEGSVYTVQGDNWYQVEPGSGDWQLVDSDRTIKTLNSYHGTEIKTQSEKDRARAATVKPPTVEAFEKEEPPRSVSDIERVIKEATKPEPPREKDVAEQAGEVLEERGMIVGERVGEGDIGIDEETYKMYSTGADMLLNTTPRPKDDPIAQRQWDEKHGDVFGALGPTGENVETAIRKQQTLAEEKQRTLERLKFNGFDEDSRQYKLDEEMFDRLIEEATLEVEQSQKSLEAQRESFRNHLDYKQSPKYAADLYNSPLSKLKRAQNHINNMTYGSYDEKKYSEAWSEAIFAEEEINREKLLNFQEWDIDAFYGDQLTDSQKAQLKLAQKAAKEITDKPLFVPGEAQKIVEETYSFLEASKESNNRVVEAISEGKDLSESLLDRKKSYFQQDANWLTGETKEIFGSTLDIHDFVSQEVESGNMVVDPITGVLSVSEDVDPYVRDYINNRLEELMSKYTEAKGKIYSNNRKVAEEKGKVLKSKEAALAKLRLDIENGRKTWYRDLIAKATKLKEEIDSLKREIRSLNSDGDTFFLNDPNKIALNTASNMTGTARQIFQSIPDGITPKQKFDMFYEALRKKNAKLREDYGIQESRLDAYGETLRDIFNWESLGVKLSDEEKEWYKNKQMIKQLAPLYYVNDWGVTDESGGFWRAFMTNFGKLISPNTGKYWNETDAVATANGMARELGFTEEDFADGMTISKLDDRMDIDFYSWESGGGLVGTSAAIMTQLMMAMGTYGGVVKEGTNLLRLLEKGKKAKDLTTTAREFQRLHNAFKTSMSNTRLGRFLYASGATGTQFEIAGTVFPNGAEELRFINGVAGAMAASTVMGTLKPLSPSNITKFFGGIFGGSTDKAVALMKRYGDYRIVRLAKAQQAWGIGEMPEEFAQELCNIYRNELNGRGFFEAVNDTYFKDEEALTRFEQLLLGSYAMGLSFGTVMSSFQNDMWSNIPENRHAQLETVIKDIQKDFASSVANADIEAGRIVNNEEALEAETKTEKDAVQERKTEEVDVAEEARTGEGVVEEDQEAKTPEEVPTEERINAKTLEEATRLHEQGYRPEIDGKVDKEASVAELANFFFTRPSIDMVKPAEPTAQSVFQDFMAKAKEDGLTLDEAAARAEQEGTFDDDINFQEFIKGAKDSGLTLDEAINRFEETRDMSLADKIRALKQGADPNTMYGSLIPISLINKAVNTVLEGAALTAENVQKFIDYIKKSKEYLNAKAEKRANMDAELEQLSEYLASQEAAKDIPEGLTKQGKVDTEWATQQSLDSLGNVSSRKLTNLYKKYIDPNFSRANYEAETGTKLEKGSSIAEIVSSNIEKGVAFEGVSDENVRAFLGELGVDVPAKPAKPIKPTEAVKSIKEKVAQFRRGFVEGQKEGKAETKEKAREKQKAIEQIKAELLEYARIVLPKAEFNKLNVTSMMNRIRKADTREKLEEAMDAVDAQVKKFEEKVRKDTAARILTKLKDRQIKKGRGTKKISKISVEARNTLKALKEEVGVENIPNLTQEELTTLETRIDAIIAGGRGKVEAETKAKKQEKREYRETPFRILSEQNNKEVKQVEGKYAIDNWLDSKQAVVHYNGQVFDSKTQLNEYLKDRGLTHDDIGPVSVTITRGTKKDAARIYEEKTNQVKNELEKQREDASKAVLSASKAIKKVQDIVNISKVFSILAEPSKTLDIRLMDVFKGSKELRTWVQDNIIKPKEKAYRDKINALEEKRQIIAKTMVDIWGKSFQTRIPKGWHTESGISIFAPSIAQNLTNGQLVSVYSMLRSEPSMIYRVGDEFFDTKAKADKAEKDTGMPVEEVTDKYNPAIIRQIAEDGGNPLSSGLEKAAEIESFVESDEKLKATADAIQDFYNNMLRNSYEDTFVGLYGMEFKEGYYYPLNRSIEQGIDLDILTSGEFNNAASAMSNHLKQRSDSGSPSTFDFTTDALTRIYDYVNTMEHAKHFLPVAEGARNLMNPSTMAQIIEKKSVGVEKAVKLRRHMDIVLSDGKSEPLSKGAAATIARLTVVTTLAGKLGSIPKQFTSATHYLGAGLDWGVGTSDVLAQAHKIFPGIPSGILSGKEGKVARATKKVLDEATTLSEEDSKVINEIFRDAFTKQRAGGRDIDLETRELHFGLMNSTGKNLWNKLQQAALLPTTLGDVGGVLIGGVPLTLATYHHNVNNLNMTKEEALEDAMIKFIATSNKTQQSKRDDIVSLLQRDSQYRLLMTYTTSQVAAMSELQKGLKILGDLEVKDVPKLFKGKGEGTYTREEYFNAMRKATYYAMANSVFQMVAGGAIGMYAAGKAILDDDDEEKQERGRQLQKTAVYNTFWDNVSSNLQGMGITGRSLDAVLNLMRGREWFNNIPIIERLLVDVPETAKEFLSPALNAASLKAQGKIDAGEMWHLMGVDFGVLPEAGVARSEEFVEGVERITGAKNINDLWESWATWAAQEAEEGNMTLEDVIMARTPDEETGEIYKTEQEREKKGGILYDVSEPVLDWLFGFENDVATPNNPLPAEVGKKIQDAYQIEGATFKTDAEKLAESASAADPYGIKFSSKQPEPTLDPKKGLQSQEEMMKYIEEIRDDERKEEIKEREERKRDWQKSQGTYETLEEREEREEKEMYERVKKDYIRKFGQEPPKEMTRLEMEEAISGF